MDAQETPAAAVKRPALTPKALIHQKYGTKACFKIEEVQQSVDCSCPGLVIPQQSRSLYRCFLLLSDLSVTSDTFPKKDAEQSAARMAIEKIQNPRSVFHKKGKRKKKKELGEKTFHSKFNNPILYYNLLITLSPYLTAGLTNLASWIRNSTITTTIY